MNRNKKLALSRTGGLIPELRFPEFINDIEWEEKELSEVCDINPTTAQLPKRFVYIDLESVENGNLLLKKIIGSEGAPSRAQRLLRNNDVIFQMVRPYQKNNYYFEKGDDFDYVASTGYAQLRAFESSMYLYQFIHTDNFVSKVLKKCTGSNYPAINSSDLSKIVIQIPQPKEQQKIASCLSSLDEVIAAHGQKMELLKEHKKGLMQNLFTQGGEKIPKYRFKEFKKDGEWVSKQLAEIITFVNEKTSLENLSIKTYISTENLLSDYAGVISASKLPTSGNFTKYKKGDVLVSNIRPYLKKVWFSDKEGTCSNDVFVVRANSEIMEIFLSFLLRNDAFINYVMIGAKGVKMPRGDKYLISKYPISFPQRKAEQQKISSCLSALNALITAQVEKIEQLKQHKRGLMQKLFPKMND